MDIRRFFPSAGGAKRLCAEARPAASPARAKPPDTKPKPSARQPKKPTARSATAVKNKPAPPPEVEDDDDVEIIADSDDEVASKKKNVKTNGKVVSQNKTNGKDSSSKSRTADAEKASKVENTASQPEPAAPDVKAKRVRKNKALVDSDSDLETVTPASKGRKTKSRIPYSAPDTDDDSPVKRPPSSRNKRRVQELSDSAEEKEEEKPKRGAKRIKQTAEDKVQPTPKGKKIFDSDSEGEDPLPRAIRGKPGRKRKEAVIFLEDSDDEKPCQGSLDAFVTHNAPKVTKETGTKKAEKKQEVSVANFFGGAKVQRTERPAAPAKRRGAEEVDPELHDDDDFTKTLQDLDTQQAKKPRRDAPPKKEETEEEEAVKPGSSVASKLSARMKTSTTALVTRSSPVKRVTSLTAPTPSPVKRDTNSNVVPEPPGQHKTPKKGTTPSRASPRKRISKMEVTVKERQPSPSSGEKTTPPKQAEKAGPASADKKTPVRLASMDSTDKGSGQRNWGAYRSFLNREGPRALGSKEIPQGAENCLEGLTFVMTGVLESVERDEAKSLIERHGGRVTGNISNRTSYLIVGRDPGASKISKAEQCKTKQVDEDGLLDLVRTLPGKKSKYQEKAEQALKKEQSLQRSTSGGSKFTALKVSDCRPPRSPSDSAGPGKGTADPAPSNPGGAPGGEGASLMWVDRHRPAGLKQIIGQQGDKSNAKKLLSWIQKWHKNRAAGTKPSGRFYGQDDGSGHRAALLSGPPGIGKTTTAVLVCKEAGFSTIELNASDKRSKRSLKEDVAEALNNMTLVDYMGESSGVGGRKGEQHCVVMDEVDGMAGSEDRGGLQELVQLVRTTRIPILCICNDRNSPKMRTLATHCFDLRFQRPRLEQIKGALMSIAFKEGVKISPPALQELILSSNQDIRQCIHNMSMWTANHKELSYDQAKQDAQHARKDLRLGIFDVSRKIFAGGEETAKMTLNDKSDLFFQDYSFVPLFVHQNYVSVSPFTARGDRTRHLSLLARAADSICEGDLVDRRIRAQGCWSLLPTQAMLASVIPGEYMRGSVTQMIQFPAWLGRNSTTGRTDRILQELRCHMALRVSCDKRSLNMDYLPALRSRLTDPLGRQGSEGVSRVIQLMDDYDIVKDDFDNVMDITRWPNSTDPLAKLDPKTKAAFTRQYNKESHMTPYATGEATKKKRGRGATTPEEDYGMGEGEEGGPPPETDSEKEDDGLERDTMIKVKKGGKTPAGSSKGKASAKGKGDSKAKGKGKGKGSKGQR